MANALIPHSLSKTVSTVFKENFQPEFTETLESLHELLCLLDAHISSAGPQNRRPAGVDRYRNPEIRSSIKQTHLHLTAACEIAERCLKNFIKDNINNSLSKSAKENEIKVLQKEISEHEQRVPLHTSNIATLEGEIEKLNRQVEEVKNSIEETKKAEAVKTIAAAATSYLFLGPFAIIVARKSVTDNPNGAIRRFSNFILSTY